MPKYHNLTITYAEAAAPFFLGAASVPNTLNPIKQIKINGKQNKLTKKKTWDVIAELPSLKPLLNLRGTLRRYLILPVPVVFLRMALTLQLSKTQNREH